MIRQIDIESFRGLKHFEMHDLAQINLLVGTNNSGKTSLLEAIQTIVTRGDIHNLWSLLSRRGERLWTENGGRYSSEGDVSHLFTGHELAIGTAFAIHAREDQSDVSVEIDIVESPISAEEERTTELFVGSGDEVPAGSFGLRIKSSDAPGSSFTIPLTRRGGIPVDAIRRMSAKQNEGARGAQFISTAAMDSDEAMRLLQDVVLTPDEDLVIEALRTIEPSIERIAPIAMERRPYLGSSRGGVVVKCAGTKQRIPVGSLGDGIWRMLGLALAIVRSEGGVLLIDEIDTGLHYSVMADMWKLVSKTAADLGVQIFATTHSRDCYESLASVARNANSPGVVSIQRIEKDNPHATAFSEGEIVIAAERGIELR